MFNLERTIPRDSFTFMTNSSCELAVVTEDELIRAGLAYQNTFDPKYHDDNDDPFYPLTKEEGAMISSDIVSCCNSEITFYTGYSALYNGKKYLALVCESHFENKDEQVTAKSMNSSLSLPLSSIAQRTGGHVYCNENAGPENIWSNGSGNYETILFIPFEFALDKASQFTEWKTYLSGLLEGSFTAFSTMIAFFKSASAAIEK